MSPASIGGGFHLLFSARVTIPAETLNDGAKPLIEQINSVKDCFRNDDKRRFFKVSLPEVG